MRTLHRFRRLFATSRPSRVFLAALCAAAGPVVSEAAETGAPAPPTRVVMQFDWIFNAQFAGFYQAIEQGFYADAGLAVELRGGVTTPDTVAATLEEPAISFGSVESNVLLADVADGARARALGTMFQASPMGWMYLRGGGIQRFADLADARVGIHSDGRRVLKLLLRQAGADVSGLETFKASHDPGLLLSGKADALQCYYIDEFVKLEQEVGDRAGIFLAKDHGYHAYSQVMFTHVTTVRENPEVVRAFLRATKAGWRYAFEHPGATVDLILAEYSPELDRAYQLRSLAKIEELMVPVPGALFRPMDPAVLEKGQARLLDHGLIGREVDVDALLAQQFLPNPSADE